MRGNIEIHNNKVYKDGKELTGMKKFLTLIFGYFLAAFVLVAVVAILLLVGGVVTIGIPIIIAFVLLCVVVSLILGLIKMIFR